MADSTITNTGLGKDAFLQLMVTQMKYQDPLQPQDNSQFLAQLAQFSALEQMTNISDTENAVLTATQATQQLNNMMFAHQLIGSSVQVQTGSGGTDNGTVSGIKFVQGEAQIVVNGNAYPLTSLTEMEGSP